MKALMLQVFSKRRVWIAGVLAFAAGCAIAWMDTRPNWDDTGITVGALILVSGIVSLAGLRWWITAILVAGPLLLAEMWSPGWGFMLAPVFSILGALGGAFVRRLTGAGE